MTERTVTMTIYKIEANLFNITNHADQRYRFIPGFVSVSAQGAGEFHTWQISPSERCWIGDTGWHCERDRSGAYACKSEEDHPGPGSPTQGGASRLVTRFGPPVHRGGPNAACYLGCLPASPSVEQEHQWIVRYPPTHQPSPPHASSRT